MTRISFEGTVREDGKILPDHQDLLSERMRKLRGKRVRVVVEPWSGSKTLPQLGYFFSTVVPLWAEHAGYDEDEMYLELWRAFFPMREVVSKLTGEVAMERPRISDSTAEEFSSFLDRTLREADSQGIRIPPPKGTE